MFFGTPFRRLMLDQTKFYPPNHSELDNILDFITEALLSSGLDSSTCDKTRFRTEDLVLMLMDHATEGSSLKVMVRKTLTTTTVRLVCGGAEFDYREAVKELFSDALDEEMEMLVHEKLLKHYEQDVVVSHRGRLNIITIIVARRKINQLVTALASVLIGITAGLVVKMLCPGDAALYIAEHIFGTGTSLFLNADKMVVPFLVFFSIASGISGFGDLRDLGRVFFRINIMFTATSFITLLMTYGVYRLIPLGNTALKAAADITAQVEAINPGSGSLSEMLIGIVPANILQAFVEMNMLQLLFLAMLFGIAVSGMKEKGRRINDVFTEIENLFEQVTRIIIRFMPVCVACSMASMVIKLNPSSIVSVSGWLGLIYLCDLLVLGMLFLLLLLLGRTSPIWFLRQYGQVMVTSFAVASSSGVMPMNMQTCRDKLEISPKIYSFSIPLGIVINMDGGCVTLLISAMFLSKVYGITLTWEILLSLIITVYLLSVAAPSVPGGILLCLPALLPQIGVPVSGITIIIGLYFMVSMMQTMTNVTSTTVCTYLVDRWEKADAAKTG